MLVLAIGVLGWWRAPVLLVSPSRRRDTGVGYTTPPLGSPETVICRSPGPKLPEQKPRAAEHNDQEHTNGDQLFAPA